MIRSRLRAFGRSVLAALVTTASLAGVAIAVAASPAEAAVTAVKGEACSYFVNVGLFGGPQTLNGCNELEGSPAAPRPPQGGTNISADTSYSPHVRLPLSGSGGSMSASDDGAAAVYGPATIHGGRFPEDVATTPASGPQSASTSGSPASGSVTSVAEINLHPAPIEVPCYEGYAPPCHAPGGFGPWPVEGDSMHVECTANESGVSGYTQLTNAQLGTTTDGDGNPIDIESVPELPPVNYTRHGEITNVGDVFTVVYNEQTRNADGSLTIIGTHMYLFGPTAVGEVVRGMVTCGTTPAAGTPADTTTPTCGPPVVAPVSAEDPTPRVPRTELVGVFDAGRPATRTVTDGVTTASSPTVTSASAGFQASDVGASVMGRAIPNGVTITAVTNSTTATISQNATASTTGSTFTIRRGNGLQSIANIRASNATVQVGEPTSQFSYLKVTPGKTGPQPVTATRINESQPMYWSFDATDVAGNTVRCEGAPPTELWVSNVIVDEGTGGPTSAAFTVTRTGTTTSPATVKYSTGGGSATASSDYTAIPSGTVLSFAPGETSKTIAVSVVGDNLAEKDETFNVTLSAPVGAALGDAAGTATVLNDDGEALLSVASVVVNEGNSGTTPVTFTITRSGNVNGTSSASYATGGGNAAAGGDYNAVPSTTVTFNPGQTTKTVTTTVIGDTGDEVNETFNLTLSVPVGARIADGSGTAYIDDDDGNPAKLPPPSTFYAVEERILGEGNPGDTTSASFTISRYGNTSVATSVKYKTTDGTAKAADSDYTTVPLTDLTFNAGETTKTVTVTVTADDRPEPNEAFNVLLSSPSAGSATADASGSATLLNDDGAAHFGVGNVRVVEGNAGETMVASFTITRSGNANGISTVKYKTTDGTAKVAGNDYTAVPLTSVTFNPGETTKTVAVNVTGDTAAEVNEAFTLLLSAPSAGSVLADASGTATIFNDD